MTEKGCVKKEETPKCKDEEKEQKSPAPKKPEKRKFLREGIEIKEDGIYFELNSCKKVCVSKFKGAVTVDIRTYYTKKGTDECFPTKKGIALTVDAWKKLKTFIEDIDEAIENEST